MKRVVRFELKDRCNNVSYLTVSVDKHKATHYSLVTSGGIPESLANICQDIGIFPAFDHGGLLNDVGQALDKCYPTVTGSEINPEYVDES